MKHAFRSLAKSPAFTVIALLTLALGIGANTTSFSVLNALLLHVPPYPEPDALVRVFRTTPAGRSGAHAPANFLDDAAQNTVFTQMAAVQSTNFNLGEPGQPADRLRGLLVSAEFFPLLRTAPALGRTFTAHEDRPGRSDVLVLSHATWLQRFGADPGIVGRVMRVDGAPVTIVGVMPASFDDAQLRGEVALWRPLAFTDAQRAERENTSLSLVARLKPGAALAQAQAGMDTVAAQLARAFPQVNENRGLSLVPLGESTQDETGRGITWLVLGLSGFVLACWLPARRATKVDPMAALRAQ